MIEGSEKAKKEENFGSNEENYSIPKALLNRRGVVALECSFSNDVSSSLEYS